MNCWFISIVHVICTCTATEILYVLPDNVSDVNCPSQPCATLGQYLLDNGSLPVLSNVEYHFLPGDHQVVSIITIYNAFNFSLIGLSQAKLVCRPQTFVGVVYSFHVSINNLVFSQCNSVLSNKPNIDIVASLVLYHCSHCKVKDVIFFGYGFAGINLFLNSYLHNITIDITDVKPSKYMCGRKFLITFEDVGYDLIHDFILIDRLSIHGYNEICYQLHEAMEITLYNIYGLTVELYNSWFYDMNQRALFIHMEYTNSSLLIKNCTFTYIMHKPELIDQVVHGMLSVNDVIITFENCKFHYNIVLVQLQLDFAYSDGLCVHPSNVTIENSEFIGNYGSLIHAYNLVHPCTANILFNGTNDFTKNNASTVMYFTYMAVVMNSMIVVSDNDVVNDIFSFNFCDITFTKTITFLSNVCNSVIFLISLHHLPYMIVMDYANITFSNTIHHQSLIFGTGPLDNEHVSVFPNCIFQYMVSTDDKYNTSKLLKLYTINFSGNKRTSTYNLTDEINSVYDFLAHCKWLPTAVFNGYSPGYINQQIIHVDGHQWIYHKRICYCPHDEDYNCTVDLLGPVYPGQVLKVDLCIPQANRNYVVTVETHTITLPRSVCKLAHQTEFINSVGNSSKTLNFTIRISEAYEVCELFLLSHQLFRNAFYVQLLPCPVGFMLQNGMCDCDPFLPPDIDTCYIDLPAIRRPANTWITAHTLTNNTTDYLLSDCPMDYCLPYSTNVNLAHPDLQCQFNRTGILCSQCQHPLSMVFASSRCMKCTNVHILITIIVIVAGIVLVVLLYVLNLTVTNGTINGIIFYANIVSINDSVFLLNDNVFKPLRVFISFTNLDLGIETCFYNGMDSYVKMWLQLFFPSYLIMIAVSIIIASRYSSRILRLTYRRSLPVLATLFLLSYTGVLRVVLTVLFSYSTITHYPSGDKQVVWSIDASVPLFGLKFTILFIICIVLFLILIPFNITLLFTRYLSQFRVVNYFKPLMDAFQGSYRNEYYYWVAVHMMFRSIFYSLYVFQVKLRLILATIILVIFTSYYGYFRPNKNKTVNFQELSILVNLTVMYAASIQDNEKIFSIITNVMMSLALFQFGIIVLCHFLVYTCHCNFTIKEKLMIYFKRKKSNHCSFNVALLDIPECTHKYNEYQDGLVSDDFNFN